MTMTSDEELRELLKYLHDEQGLRWRAIANLPEFYGKVSFGTLSQHYKGRYIASPDIRIALGLPAHTGCGHCHVFEKYAPLLKRRIRKRTRWDQYPVSVIRNSLVNREILHEGD